MHKHKTTLKDHNVECWRWNINPAWSHFSSMIQESEIYKTTFTEFERHRAAKSCLYFGVAAIEELTIKEIRQYLTDKGENQEKILRTIREVKSVVSA